jgi:hypothetical protein
MMSWFCLNLLRRLALAPRSDAHTIDHRDCCCEANGSYYPWRRLIRIRFPHGDECSHILQINGHVDHGHKGHYLLNLHHDDNGHEEDFDYGHDDLITKQTLLICFRSAH